MKFIDEFIIAAVSELIFIAFMKFVEKSSVGPRIEKLGTFDKKFPDDRIDAGKKITFMKPVKPIIEKY